MNGNDRPTYWHVIRWVILGIVVIIVLWFTFSAFSYAMQPMLGFHYFYRPFFFPFGFMFFFLVLFMIFGALRWMFWPWRYRRRYLRHHDQSYYILRERYARGEITKDQFEQMMRDLKTHDQDLGTR